MKNQHFFFRLLLVVASLLLAYPAVVRAQPGTGGPQPGASPTTVPLDGGASLLLAAGLGLGIRRLKRRRSPAS